VPKRFILFLFIIISSTILKKTNAQTKKEIFGRQQGPKEKKRNPHALYNAIKEAIDHFSEALCPKTNLPGYETMLRYFACYTIPHEFYNDVSENFYKVFPRQLLYPSISILYRSSQKHLSRIHVEWYSVQNNATSFHNQANAPWGIMLQQSDQLPL
jgi:hypothetical protein